MINAKMTGMLLAAFVAGSFVASPELRAYAANTVGSADIINNTIQSVDIKDSEVKAADIAANAVGASELIGVTKLKFLECSITDNIVNVPGTGDAYSCSAPGVDADDNALATNNGNSCYMAVADSGIDTVLVILRNTCAGTLAFGTGTVSIIVYDT